MQVWADDGDDSMGNYVAYWVKARQGGMTGASFFVMPSIGSQVVAYSIY